MGDEGGGLSGWPSKAPRCGSPLVDGDIALDVLYFVWVWPVLVS